MKYIPLYKYVNDEKTIVSTARPVGEYQQMYRLVADEGYVLTNGEIETNAIDVYDKYNNDWYEKPLEAPTFAEPPLFESPSPVPPPAFVLPDIEFPPTKDKTDKPSKDEAILEALVDHEYRLTLIEMGVQ